MIDDEDEKRKNIFRKTSSDVKIFVPELISSDDENWKWVFFIFLLMILIFPNSLITILVIVWCIS